MVDNSIHEEVITRRERERLMHRKEIMDAAVEVFSKKGFFNATLDEIAQKAEFSKGTIYLYFSSKEELLYSILQENIGKEITLRFAGVFEQGRTLREDFELMFDDLASLAFEKKDIFELAIAQHVAGYPALSPEKALQMNDAHKKFWDKPFERIKRAIAEGELRDISPHAITGILHGSLDHMMLTRWFCETPEQLHEAIKAFFDILFNGIAKEKETGQ